MTFFRGDFIIDSQHRFRFAARGLDHVGDHTFQGLDIFFTARHFEFDAETSDQITPGSWEMLRDDLSRTNPKFIIDTSPSDYLKYGKYPVKKYPYMKELLEREYYLETTISSMDIYRLKS